MTETLYGSGALRLGKVDITFLKRPTDVDDPAYHEQCRAYWDFVDSFDHSQNPDLYEFFGWDFFHDGQIEEPRFSSDFKTISFRVMSPSIPHRAGGNTYAWFRCEFEGVVWFHLATERIDELDDPMAKGNRRIEFNVSEINTLTEQIEFYQRLYGRPYYSLAIETFPAHRVIGFVFERVNVLAEEPLAFALIRRSGDYDVPLYKRGARAWK